jgi:DNA mismatch repair protein MutS
MTPLMQQYHELKARHPNELLFFRLGDFFELFDEDARRAAPILEVALTHRQKVPMCGVPAHALDPYIAKLLRAGLRAVIADQLEDPSAAKGLVKRGIVRVVTPGTLQEDALLESRKSNYLAAISWTAELTGLAFVECSTGEFLATEFAGNAEARLFDELARLAPSEIVVSQTIDGGFRQKLEKRGYTLAELPGVDFSVTFAEERLKRFFGAASLRGYGLEARTGALIAAGAALRYLENTQCGRSFTLRTLRTYALDDFLQMDANTLDHLELVGDSGKSRAVTLLKVLDKTFTPMGARLLRRWLISPLKKVTAIQERQRKVEFFFEEKESRRHLRAMLHGTADIERILARLTARTASPRDLAALGQALRRCQKIKSQLGLAYQQSTRLGGKLPDFIETMLLHFPEDNGLAALLEKAIVEAPPATGRDGGVIQPGYNAELDEVRSWISEGKTRLMDLERREKEQTGITTLKVGYNNIFGYYLEVTKSHIGRVPAHYIRKQTMVNAERYITPELKEFETKILGAEERALRLETALIEDLRGRILQRSALLQQISESLAEIDVFLTLADIADLRRWSKPLVDDSDALYVREGRHPVLEEVLSSGTFVPNDIDLNGRDKQILILTGPNMSGKSTYLRQTALIAVLAQMGSYVPAAEARVGVIDRLFTRIGASDRLSEGESTFMVEMVETARILNHATPRSLVILDEVGRGTSTYDGMSIAWACLEYLNNSNEQRAMSNEPTAKSGLANSSLIAQNSLLRGPKVLFATHFFELTQLAQEQSGIRNAHVTVREWGDDVVFLHKVEYGPADRAYGIHVARLAGVPGPVLQRAQTLLRHLEQTSVPTENLTSRQPLLFSRTPSPLAGEGKDGGVHKSLNPPPTSSPSRGEEIYLELKKELANLDLDSFTPLKAMVKLQELKDRLRNDGANPPDADAERAPKR